MSDKRHRDATETPFSRKGVSVEACRCSYRSIIHQCDVNHDSSTKYCHQGLTDQSLGTSRRNPTKEPILLAALT